MEASGVKCLGANRKLEMGKGPGLRKEVAGDSPGGGLQRVGA